MKKHTCQLAHMTDGMHLLIGLSFISAFGSSVYSEFFARKIYSYAF